MSLFSILVCTLLLPQDTAVQLRAPASAPAGSAIEISWSEGGSAKDFITIVPKDAPAGSYKAYAYAQKKIWKTNAPDKPGSYEIRYLGAAAPYPTLVSQLLTITPVSAELKVPAEVAAGSEFSFEWAGPNNARDFITIVAADAPERSYEKYIYTKAGSPAKLKAPDLPGDYEVRYLTGQKYLTVASVPIKVQSLSATIAAPAQVAAGSEFTFEWTGPDNPYDFITIVEANAPERAYEKYIYTHKGSPAKLKAPDKPGDYELRYLTGQKYLTVTSVPIKVGSVSATLSVTPEVDAGARFEVKWTGPDNPNDFITIVPAGAEKRAYGKYVYTNRGNPSVLPAPDTSGDYEVRYLTGQSYTTLDSVPVKVRPVKASLKAPDEVKAGSMFEVTWSGPGNPQDFISTAKSGADPRGWETYSYTKKGPPTKVRAPLEPGNYVVRYQTGQKFLVLAEKVLTVTPPDMKPGQVKVVFEKPLAILAGGAGLEVILDASGSMLQRLDGKRRIEIAKDVLVDLVENRLSAGAPVAMRVFGHREADSCRTDLEMPLAPLDKDAMVSRIKSINAMNLAKTPIAASLAQVVNDLAGVKGQRLVVLITDGEETCGGDPAATIAELKAAGIDIRVNIVGFAIEDEDLKKSFALWSDLGGGNYFDARDAGQLSDSIAGALQIPFDLVNQAGEVVADGLVGGQPIVVPVGTYRLKTRETPAREISNVEVKSEEIATVTLK